MKTRKLVRDICWRFHISQACFFFLLTTVYAELHSLRYYYTFISNPVGFPAYSLKVFIDDMKLASYNDETRLFQSTMKGRVNADYWVDNTLDCQNTQQLHKHHIYYVNNAYNETSGEYLYQVKFGCTVDGDGKYGGYLEYARNGKEFIMYDKERILYIPMTFQAQIITDFYTKKTFYGPLDKNSIEVQCPEMLQRFLKYASYELQKKVRPEVKVWGRRQSDKVLRLQCLVYGFHPRAVHVKWVRNGIDDVPSDEMSPILPHPDGTYQIRISAEVPIREGDTFSCHVDHSSLGSETLSVIWDPPVDGLSVGVIVGIIIGIVVLVAIITALLCIKMKKSGYKSTNTSDTASDSSNQAKA